MNVPATVVRIDIKWLDGGGDDSFFVLTPYPADLRQLADALEGPHDFGDQGFSQAAECLRRILPSDVVANNPTRFAAVCGDSLEIYSPAAKHVIEIQELPVCTVLPLRLESGYDGDHLVRHDSIGAK